MRDQSPVLRLDFHERLELKPLKGRIESILDLELIPEVGVAADDAQVSLRGQMTVKGTYLAETLPLSEYELSEDEWEQDMSPKEVRRERTSELFPFQYRIPLEIVLPRGRVDDPQQLQVKVAQMDFELLPSNELELLAELVVEGVRDAEVIRSAEKPDGEPAERRRNRETEAEVFGAGQDAAPMWTLQLVSGREKAAVDADGEREGGEGDRPGEGDADAIDAAAWNGQEMGKEEEEKGSEEFEIVVRPEQPTTWATDASAWSETAEEPLAALSPGGALSDGAETLEQDSREGRRTDETADAVETAEAPDREAAVETADAVRVMVSTHSKEQAEAGRETTWTEWLTAAEKQKEAGVTLPQGTAARPPEGPAADAKGGRRADEPDPPSAERAGRQESEATPTLSDYLAPILRGKAERFVSLRLYRVKETEHVEDVAQQFNVSVTELMRLNRIEEPTFLAAGNVLFIPLKKE